jgi:GT2 family glycosyltransferase
VWAWGSVLLQPHGAVESAGDEYAPEGYAWKRWKGRSALDLPDEPYETFGPAGAAPVFARSIFERLGGYDERFFLYYEDVDLSARARLAGFRALTVPTARTRHILGASGDEATLWFHVARNRPWVAVRVLPNLRLRLLASVFADEIRHARSYDHLVPTVRGLLASLVGLPSAVLTRRRLQRTASANSTLGTALLGSADCPP